jgi:hypothetical protein
MPSSKGQTGDRGTPVVGNDDPRWRGFLLTAALSLAVLLALLGSRVVWFDAYWLFRAHPPWLDDTGGANRLLDRQTRRSKILQAMTRSYRVALIGSSTTYHGLDPADADAAPPGGVFNVGISALMADELPIVAEVAASHGAERAVIGLDYYMFSRRNPPVQLSPALADATGRANTLLGSIVSRYAIMDSRLGEVEGGDDPGSWTYDGFRVTPKLAPSLTIQNDAMRRRTAGPYRPETLAALDRTLEELHGRQVDVYLSPVSDAQRRIMEQAGLLDDFARWRADIAAAAVRHGARFSDLADLGAAFPFDPAGGSTDIWLDNLHFTPLLGRAVLQAVGLRAGPRPR